MNKHGVLRIVIALAGITGLAGVFLFQGTDVAGILGSDASNIVKFLINRTIRFLLNDIFAIALIFAIFFKRKYVIFSLWVQLVGVFLFLIPYFILKLNFPSYNGPLINFLHRLILNPILLLLLIPAFYYQKQHATAHKPDS